ncbi:hypothetical protein XENOCAPTIV_012018 [Xenoophorus captivus]|uniref:Sema domain-containing protein n=1 Tax=Xenoophorus captivus TaxID=1517983 RepID=A0ABV0RC61_9TELE
MGDLRREVSERCSQQSWLIGFSSDVIVFDAVTMPFLPSDGDLYAGTSVDFMGANAAIFRTSVQGSSQHYIRTEAYDHNWLSGEQLVVLIGL